MLPEFQPPTTFGGRKHVEKRKRKKLKNWDLLAVNTVPDELQKTKKLLNSFNKLVFSVSQRVQEISEQMTMVTHTITGLVQSINNIAQFMNNQNYTLESPQSGQPPLPIIPTLTLPDYHTQDTQHKTTRQTTTDPSPHKQEGY